MHVALIRTEVRGYVTDATIISGIELKYETRRGILILKLEHLFKVHVFLFYETILNIKLKLIISKICLSNVYVQNPIFILTVRSITRSLSQWMIGIIWIQAIFYNQQASVF
jgi:hypothetical protein